MKGYVMRGQNPQGVGFFVPCETLDAAIREWAAFVGAGLKCDVRIFAVADDGTETPIPTYEEALAEVARLETARATQANINEEAQRQLHRAVAKQKKRAEDAEARLTTEREKGREEGRAENAAELARLREIEAIRVAEIEAVLGKHRAAFGVDMPKAPAALDEAAELAEHIDTLDRTDVSEADFDRALTRTIILVRKMLGNP